MQIASRNFTARLTMANAYRFTNGSKMVPWLGVENPIKFRVMSTPTWPAPYYQRMVKAYPVRRTPPLTQTRTRAVSCTVQSSPMTPTGSVPRSSSERPSEEGRSLSTLRTT